MSFSIFELQFFSLKNGENATCPYLPHSSMGHGSELHGTLNTVTHHTNSVKKEETHYFGKSQLEQGSKAPDHRPTVAML